MTESIIGINTGMSPIQNLGEINITKLCDINVKAFSQTLFAIRFWILLIVGFTIIEFVISTLSRGAKGKRVLFRKVNVSEKWIKIDQKVREISLMVRLIAGLNLLEIVIVYVGVF